ncbi:MAG: hypothetical protein R3300_12460, partial [Candidatus Promineifilaceae bacterium]|nr:hypothetical protein [Candidatus Promineifilaceae bacterium]
MRGKPTRRRSASQQDEHRVRNIIIGVAVAVGVLGLGALLFLSLQEPDALEGLRRIAGLSRGHSEEVSYDSEEGLPPAGGIHSSTWQNCGIYTEPVET